MIMVGGILGENFDRRTPMQAFDWAAVDLRPGTPFGELLRALIEFATEEGAFCPRPAGRRPLPGKKFFEDYKLARSRWPGVTKPRPLSRLMHEHSRKVFGGRYNYVTPDAIRKRIGRLLQALRTVDEARKKKGELGPEARAKGKRGPWPDLTPELTAKLATDAVRATIAAKRRHRRGK
jgi:hypothetical protein